MSTTVLIADDDEYVRDAVSWCLRNEGYAVLTAADGAEAIHRSANAAVDLFILDLHMPFLGGAGVVAAIRAKPCFRATPILFMTACPKDAPVGFAVVSKAGSPEMLLTAVESILSTSKHARAAARGRTAPRISTARRAGRRSNAGWRS